MLTKIYIEAMLVDEELADCVWELWNAGVITDDLAAMAWWLLTTYRSGHGIWSLSDLSLVFRQSLPTICANTETFRHATAKNGHADSNLRAT